MFTEAVTLSIRMRYIFFLSFVFFFSCGHGLYTLLPEMSLIMVCFLNVLCMSVFQSALPCFQTQCCELNRIDLISCIHKSCSISSSTLRCCHSDSHMKFVHNSHITLKKVLIFILNMWKRIAILKGSELTP